MQNERSQPSLDMLYFTTTNIQRIFPTFSTEFNIIKYPDKKRFFFQLPHDSKRQCCGELWTAFVESGVYHSLCSEV